MGQPKALLTFRGRTFLESVLDAVHAVGVKHPIVVLGDDADKILSQIELHGVKALRNEEIAAGPIGSIRAAIRHVIDHPVDAMLVWPVDMPHVAISTVELLIDRFRSTHRPIVVPVFDGRRGHPVLFGKAVFEELLAVPDGEGAGAGAGARAVVRADPSRVDEVPVEDSAVVEDLNTPQDYEALVRREDEIRS
jgi:molybdenum cofactor cytidylyltransferase